MKCDKILTVAGTRYKIVSDSLTLEQSTPGRGIFAVQSEKQLAGIAQLAIGINNQYEVYATGYIDNCRQIDAKQQRLMFRETAAVLAGRWPLSFRNVIISDVLADLSVKTGLAFSLEKADWNTVSMPHFINIGTGLEALNLLSWQLDIDDFVWQCQPDGSIYLGSRAGAKIYQKVIALPATFFTDLSARGASCPIVPGFRPGRRLRIGNGDIVTLDIVTINADSMRLGFE